jgi:hypothetical protein
MPLSFPMWLWKKWYFKDKYLFLADILGELTVDPGSGTSRVP